MAVDLPARSFDLAHPDVASPLQIASSSDILIRVGKKEICLSGWHQSKVDGQGIFCVIRAFW